jgi:aspartate/methionine/tyrosine aminotransferase
MAVHPTLPEELPLYPFARLDAIVADRLRGGREVLDLTKSDPADPPPAVAVDALRTAAGGRVSHHYPPFAGAPALREAVADWYAQRAGLRLDPDRNVVILAGSKEGLVHLALALARPGEAVLAPDPAFPAYAAAARLAGAELRRLPLVPEDGYLPDLAAAVRAAKAPVRLVYLNYPHNPTGAVAPPAYFAAVAALARREGFWVCHDFAYADVYFGPEPPPSFLAAPGALEIGVETVTWSKSYAMQGFRLAALVGNEAALAAFAHVETNVMAGVYLAIQAAGLAALTDPDRERRLGRLRAAYRDRLARLAKAFESAGWSDLMPAGAVYLWPQAPAGLDGEAFARLLLDEAGVAVTPGSAFGRLGRSRVRLSATAPQAVIEAAADAIGALIRRERLRPPAP